MFVRNAIHTSVLVASTVAQTYTGCHLHGSVEYCYGPDGEETPFSVSEQVASTTPASAAASTTLSSVTVSATPASITASTTGADEAVQTTAITECHLHATDVFCLDGHGEEVQVSLTQTGTPTVPPSAAYTDCHSHGEESYCVDDTGSDVLVLGALDGHGDPATDEGNASEASEAELSCHFHAGVEHCVTAGSSEGESGTGSDSAPVRSCDAPQTREYNIGLRIGSIFIILFTSGLAVFFPLFLHKLPFGRVNGYLFTGIKQFGTGIIISTAFVHLYTHASLMFTNECLEGIHYEATTSAVVMAGLFVAFLIEYTGYRYVLSRQPKNAAGVISEHSSEASAHDKSAHGSGALQDISHSHSPANFNPNTTLAVGVMEAGILFHSVLIGLTLVVAPDSSGNTSGYYNTLLAVIVFHQFFEGLALGARIALLPTGTLKFGVWSKMLMALAFALVTPLGMAIGIGILNKFNGNDQSTILTIAVLDALSAGVLLWVGVVDMWGRDWAVTGGEMVDAGLVKVIVGMGSLIIGMILMSVLGKWA